MSELADSLDVKENPERSRFEARRGEHLAVAEYEVTPEGMRFTHTLVPSAMEGQGVGSKLAKAGLDACRARGLQALPDCPFIAGYIRKHPECHDLLHPAYRASMGL